MRNQNKIGKLSGWIGICFMAFLPGLALAESVHANIVDTFVALSGGPHEGERVNHAEGIVAEGILRHRLRPARSPQHPISKNAH